MCGKYLLSVYVVFFFFYLCEVYGFNVTVTIRQKNKKLVIWRCIFNTCNHPESELTLHTHTTNGEKKLTLLYKQSVGEGWI